MRRTVVLFALALLASIGPTALAAPAPSCPPDELAGITAKPLAAPAGVVVHRDLAYVTGGHVRQKLDLWLPAPKKNAPAYPVIVYIHGGGWKHGNKSSTWTPIDYVSRGYAVASIDYRFSTDAIFPAQIQDAKAAVRWLRANAKKYNLDAQHFASWGESAGGHLASLLGTSNGVAAFDVGENLSQSSAVQAVVDYYGPTDLLQMAAEAGSAAHDAPCSAESQLVGGALQTHKKRAKRANPITYIDGRDPPFFIAHGDQDDSVPPAQSVLLRDALKKAGVPRIYISVAGVGHEFDNATTAQLDDLDAKTRAFLAKHIGP
jgi:acetyl esterase/lipase